MVGGTTGAPVGVLVSNIGGAGVGTLVSNMGGAAVGVLVSSIGGGGEMKSVSLSVGVIVGNAVVETLGLPIGDPVTSKQVSPSKQQTVQHGQSISSQSALITIISEARAHTPGGIDPVKLVCSTFSWTSLARFPSSVGIVPLKRLLLKYANRSDGSVQTDAGI